ncbi:hypothetical protein [Tannerella forsythia]|uniref:ATP-grasp domain-containing protein n=1 Tax=Tannerella forsythia TaxID=28112 RepID=A0A3P1YUX8_TANFO|nr:hypothetical protein [Tannerella forsythia]RRD74822.1 hypothetical protein EII41_07460 [Tannerella forsythia]
MKTSNKALHLFNPGHETAIASGVRHYTPDAVVQKMMSDLSLLPLWYGNEGDYVLTSEAETARRFIESLPPDLQPSLYPVSDKEICRLTAPLDASPWGLSPHSLRLFEKLQKRGAPLSIPAWKEIYRTLTHRRAAADGLRETLQRLPGLPSVSIPCFYETAAAVKTHIETYPPPFLLKTPFSCSGQGVYPIMGATADTKAMQWIEGALRRQGAVSIEPMLEKVCDFAMEFYMDGADGITYKGLSVFETQTKGAFSGGRLGQSEVLQKYLTTYIPEETLTAVREAITLTLKEILGNVYRGYLGIDMLIFKHNGEYAVHPFIEMNLRYTMGLVACELSRRLLHPASQGRFMISYEKKGATLRTDMLFRQQYPLQLADGRIRSGYFSLCPVTAETTYRAGVLIHAE